MIQGVFRRDDYDDNRQRRRRRRRLLDDDEVGSLFGSLTEVKDDQDQSYGGEGDHVYFEEEGEEDYQNNEDVYPSRKKASGFVEPKVNPYAYDYLNVKNIDDI